MADLPDVVAGEKITSEWGNEIRDRTTLPTWEVDESVEVFGPVEHTTSFGVVATLNLAIPAYWASWKCMATATFFSSNPNLGNEYTIRIDGTDQQIMPVSHGSLGEWLALSGRRVGLVTTGPRAVALMGREGSGTGQTSRIFLYARAVRTS